MARPYAGEMAKLAETMDWVAAADIGDLRRAVRAAGPLPMRITGSGGSLTAAHALASLHQRFTGRLAAVATPLETIAEPLEPTSAAWLLSAGGRNVDIIAAVEDLIAREPRQLSVLCGRADSTLAELCRRHPFVDLLLYPPPAGKDGFLATNSLLAFTALLTRAYTNEYGADVNWEDAAARLVPLLAGTASQAWEVATAPLWTRATTVVLHGPSTRIGAVDLESKFTEAAVGNIHIADYRNFGHGRHHWLAKRGGLSGVLAFVSEADRPLAERTLGLVPSDIPQARIELAGGPDAAALGSLAAALLITGWAGAARGIDPGRPGVPEFGRKLYNLSAPKLDGAAALLPPRQAAAIERKSGKSVDTLTASGELSHWSDALDVFLARMGDARFAGIVFDYDGTIVDTRCRSQPAAPKMAAQLVRLVDSGARIAVATGRGRSVQRDLQAALPRRLWPEILVGYYNGAEVAPLDNNEVPDGSGVPSTPLAALASALRRQPELASCANQEDRPHQITLSATRPVPEHHIWDLVYQTVLSTGIEGVAVARSGHSVDVLAAGVSKLNVIRRLREAVGSAPVLTIGDQGRWPGNDYDLLRGPFSLAVDVVSADPVTCWNLGRPGQRGPAVTLDHLAALRITSGNLRFADGAFL